jgi:hypothetical protein
VLPTPASTQGHSRTTAPSRQERQEKGRRRQRRHPRTRQDGECLLRWTTQPTGLEGHPTRSPKHWTSGPDLSPVVWGTHYLLPRESMDKLLWTRAVSTRPKASSRGLQTQQGPHWRLLTYNQHLTPSTQQAESAGLTHVAESGNVPVNFPWNWQRMKIVI